MKYAPLAAANLRAPAKWMPILRNRPVSTVSYVLGVLVAYDADIRRPMTDEQIDALILGYRASLQAMLLGYGTEEHWATCVCSLNIAMILAEWDYGFEYLSDIITALDGVFRAKLRAQRTGKWGFDGPSMQAIKHAFDVHEEQLLHTSKEVNRDAIAEVHRRRHAGNVYMEAA